MNLLNLIEERNLTVGQVARALNLNLSDFLDKLDFNLIRKLSVLLNLSSSERVCYFFKSDLQLLNYVPEPINHFTYFNNVLQFIQIKHKTFSELADFLKLSVNSLKSFLFNDRLALLHLIKIAQFLNLSDEEIDKCFFSHLDQAAIDLLKPNLLNFNFYYEVNSVEGRRSKISFIVDNKTFRVDVEKLIDPLAFFCDGVQKELEAEFINNDKDLICAFNPFLLCGTTNYLTKSFLTLIQEKIAEALSDLREIDVKYTEFKISNN